jgi:hypothetical protein
VISIGEVTGDSGENDQPSRSAVGAPRLNCTWCRRSDDIGVTISISCAPDKSRLSFVADE